MKLLTKDEAFADIDDLKNIHIKRGSHNFRFSRRWFKMRNQRTFSTFLPRIFDGKKPINMIQIGVFEGADLCWCLQNILKHPDCKVVAIDPWDIKGMKRSQEEMDGIYEKAQHNLHHWRRRIQIIRDTSQKALPDLIKCGISINGKPIRKGDWDFIVVDGCHDAPLVYTDAMNSFELVKKGGYILFDDYYCKIDKKNHVNDGVNEFLIDHGDHIKVAWQHKYCVCFQKIKKG